MMREGGVYDCSSFLWGEGPKLLFILSYPSYLFCLASCDKSPVVSDVLYGTN